MTAKSKFMQVLAAVFGIFAAGIALGVWATSGGRLAWTGSADVAPAGQHADDHDDHHHHDDEGDHVHLTENAYKNLGLKLGTVQTADHFRMLRIPAEVIERPGHSEHALVAPVTGIVSRVYAAPGQAVQVGDRLFDLQVNDEALTAAQVSLLETIARLETMEAEIKRLEPLTESGTVVGRKKLQLEYEQKELRAKRQARVQELAVRGLHQAQIDEILDQRQLIREILVLMPEQIVHDAHTHRLPVSADPRAAELDGAPPGSSSHSDGWNYTVERIDVFPGKAVRRGDDLCHLAHHTVLFIQGQAFEKEVETIATVQERNWPIQAEFGDKKEKFARGNLSILYVDNHVDPETQTFRFYIPLRNEIIRDLKDDQGKVYRSWRFKPGQRAHVLLPVEKTENQIKLPIAALVREGPQTFVFRVHEHDEEEDHAHDTSDADHDQHEDDHHEHDEQEEIFIEFEPVEVHVISQDSEHAVIANDGTLALGSDVIAMNSAYQLQLAMQVQSGGGGGHDHHHHH